MTDGRQVVSLSSLIDMAKEHEEDENEVPVGFSSQTGKLRRKHV